MKLEELFTKDVVTALAEQPISDIAELMNDRKVGTVVIVEESKPIGIVTDRDIALALGLQACTAEAPVQTIMTRRPHTLKKQEGIMRATQYMMEKHVRRLPVVDEKGRIVGIVSIDDLLPLLSRELQNLTESIRLEPVSIA